MRKTATMPDGSQALPSGPCLEKVGFSDAWAVCPFAYHGASCLQTPSVWTNVVDLGCSADGTGSHIFTAKPSGIAATNPEAFRAIVLGSDTEMAVPLEVTVGGVTTLVPARTYDPATASRYSSRQILHAVLELQQLHPLQS